MRIGLSLRPRRAHPHHSCWVPGPTQFEWPPLHLVGSPHRVIDPTAGRASVREPPVPAHWRILMILETPVPSLEKGVRPRVRQLAPQSSNKIPPFERKTSPYPVAMTWTRVAPQEPRMHKSAVTAVLIGANQPNCLYLVLARPFMCDVMVERGRCCPSS